MIATTTLEGAIRAGLHAPSREPVVVIAADLNFDYIYECPALQGGREVLIASFTRELAGAGGIVACGLARLGAEVRFLAEVGDDAEGRELSQEIGRRGILRDGVSIRPGGRTSFTLIFSDERSGAPPQVATFPGVAAEFTVSPGGPGPQIEGAELFFSCNYFLLPRLREEVPELFRVARTRGVRTAHEANAGDGWEEPGKLQLLREGIHPVSDIIFLNEMEARRLTSVDEPRAAAQRTAPPEATVVVKRGARGSIVRHRGELLEVDAFPVSDRVRDTVGAGDSYQAAFHYFLLRGLPIEACAVLGSANAASTVTRPGGTAGQLDREGLAAFLRDFRVEQPKAGRIRVERAIIERPRPLIKEKPVTDFFQGQGRPEGGADRGASAIHGSAPLRRTCPGDVHAPPGRSTPRRSFITALEGGQPPGHVPTFELVFYLTMELLGKVHPSQRTFSQWDQMSATEKKRQVADAGDTYIEVARRYGHSAIFVHGVGGMPDSEVRQAEHIREATGDEFFLMCHGDATMGIPDGEHMAELSFRLVDDTANLKRQLSLDVDRALDRSGRLAGKGIFDGLALCSDYCLNVGPFLSPSQFAEFVTPYLKRLIEGYREMGYYLIKHTDGNIMPIIDQLVACRPHALHSLDPQAGVDIAQVKRRYGKEICLIGNVNCGLLQTGTEEQVVESCRYALRNGMPGGGYIFSTSNCVYTGMDLSRYDLMMEVWRKEGAYGGAES